MFISGFALWPQVQRILGFILNKMPVVCTHFCNIEVYHAPLHLMLCSELDTYI